MRADQNEPKPESKNVIVQKVPSTTTIDIIFYCVVIVLLALIYWKVSTTKHLPPNIVFPDTFKVSVEQSPIEVKIPEVAVKHSYDPIRIEETTKDVQFIVPPEKEEPAKLAKPKAPTRTNQPKPKEEKPKEETTKPRRWYNPFTWGRKKNEQPE